MIGFFLNLAAFLTNSVSLTTQYFQLSDGSFLTSEDGTPLLQE